MHRRRIFRCFHILKERGFNYKLSEILFGKRDPNAKSSRYIPPIKLHADDMETKLKKLNITGADSDHDFSMNEATRRSFKATITEKYREESKFVHDRINS